MRKGNWVLGTGTAGSPAADVGLALLRIAAGFLLVYLHGLGKIPPSDGFVGRVDGMGFPAPLVFAWLAAAAEVAGAILIAIGLLTRPAALYIVAHFTVVVLVAHAGDSLADRELPILFGVIALALAMTGPGRFSVDAAIARRRGGAMLR